MLLLVWPQPLHNVRESPSCNLLCSISALVSIAGANEFFECALAARQTEQKCNLQFAGELLNCNTYDVAIHAAVACGVDKVICMHTENLDLPEWLSLRAAADALFGKSESDDDGSSSDSGEENLRPGAHSSHFALLVEVSSRMCSIASQICHSG